MYDGKPIYVGCCIDINRRTKSHRRNKAFDYSIIIKKYDCKKDALIAENSIIRFMSLFDEGFLNGKFKDMIENKIAFQLYFKNK